ncbi:MSHA biogenesis protein MshJ [Vibrio fluvialis]|uniref:MSHA biogenesis protein MshJ n=1 Tax=Vibrio fluvialis TaxID=676 RepID=UPI000CEB5228|nr:MSHA biogenesis protein MshJ [Vibrio fluvialis]AVH31435.1 MSHA biogenesis protein MshJ [Vibrio fluvialis]TOY93292.1 MSHA biogenesis protein MshJ [Vibrio fluvialis]TRN12347.1 MSHA biogenesis protein MshJ [Vibrio fluvialis]
MKQRWNVWSDAFAKRSQREKLLISLCGLVAVVFISLTLLVDPLVAQYGQQQTQLQGLTSSNQSAQLTIQQLQVALKKNPDESIDKEFATLQEQSQSLSMELANSTETLVSPTQMATLLQTVLDNSTKLKLISLQSLPAEPIVPSKDDPSAVKYYVHPVRLELTGNYFAIRDYLLALESLPVKYYWRSFKYQVETYPQARLILQVYTLGSREEFIGG